MKKLALLLLTLSFLHPAYANAQKQFTFSGWIDEYEFQPTIKIDSSTIKASTWEEATAGPVNVTGYFYLNDAGESIFKVTKIEIPQKTDYDFLEKQVDPIH